MFFCLFLVCFMFLVLEWYYWSGENGLLVFLDVALCCASALYAWIVARTNMLAQESSSRLDENSRNSPWFCSSISLRQKAFVLSNKPSRSSKSASPKWELMGNLVFSAWNVAQARDFCFEQRVILLRREGLAQTRARRVLL